MIVVELSARIFEALVIDEPDNLDNVAFFDDGSIVIECATQIERTIGFCKDVVIGGAVVASDGSHGDDDRK